MKQSSKKMRKVHLVCLIVIGIVASNLHNVNCCKSLRSRRHQKDVATLNDKEKISLVLLPYDNANIPDCDSYEADHVETSSELMKGITLEKTRKTKRNSPNFQHLTSHQNNDGLNDTNNKTYPHTLIATLADDNTETVSDNRKIKRNPPNKPHQDKQYMCVCEETSCSDKNCLRNQAEDQKSPSNSEDNENNSAEVLDNVQKRSDGPKKFNIPFAQNVNFDQRVIVGAKPKPSPNTFYPIYANPQVYHYTPYTIAQPGLIYTGGAPLQQNYAPAAAYNEIPSPAPIAANLLKLWKNGAQNLVSAIKNLKQATKYVPNYSSENTKNAPESPAEPGKVTTPRQIDYRLYPQIYPYQVYSTDYPYGRPYTTEIIRADQLKFIKEKPAGAKQLQYNPATTNYAPNHYTTQRADGTNNQKTPYQYSVNYQTDQQQSYANKVPYSNPSSYQEIPQYDYNGKAYSTTTPAPHSSSPVYTANNQYQTQKDVYEQPSGVDLSIEVDKVINDYRNNAPMSVPSDSELKAYSPPQYQTTPKPYKLYNQTPNVVPPASYSIQNVSPHKEVQSYTRTFKNASVRVTTLDDVNNGYAKHYNPQRTSTLRNADKKYENVANTDPDHMESLFRGLERILLNNVTVSDTPQVQAIDERPSTTYENTYRNPDNTLVQNAVKKVLNNFVPGKSADLLANYDSQQPHVLAKEESLSPDLANAHVLTKLLNVPEVENMIVDTTSNLLNQVVGSRVPDNAIKDTLRNVVKEIPRPTYPPKVSEKLSVNIRLAKRIPRYDESSYKEVFERIKSIIDKSELGQEAAQPLAQNFIVKAVKHSLDKEKGVVDEAAIRRAFNELVKSRRPTDNYSADGRRPLIVQPKETMGNYDGKTPQDDVYAVEDTGYQLAPAIPVNERRLQGGVWIETPKDLIGSRAPGKSRLEEKKRKELERQLDMLQRYDKPNSTNEITEKVGSPYYATTSQNTGQKSDVSTRQAISKYYDALLAAADPQNLQYQPPGYPSKPVVTTLNYQNYLTSSYTTPQPYSNRLNLLVDLTDKSQSQASVKQKADYSQDPAYMGKLVPLNPVNGNLDNSNLVWVGDGVKLPLTTRKMQDGSYALTLSDEVCKMFVHKKCPCCLPDAGQGVILRERRNDEQDYTDDISRGEKLTDEMAGKPDFDDTDYDQSEENNSVQRGAPYKYQRYASQDRIISGRTRALGNMLKWMKDVVTEAHQKRHQTRSSASKHKVALF